MKWLRFPNKILKYTWRFPVVDKSKLVFLGGLFLSVGSQVADIVSG